MRETGLEENTIVVFTADHGDMLGSQGMMRKQKPSDESARVPMLMRWPAGLGKKGRGLDAPINSEDLMPTLLGFAGLTVPGSVEGLDYSGYARGGRTGGLRTAAGRLGKRPSVRTARWRSRLQTDGESKPTAMRFCAGRSRWRSGATRRIRTEP